MPQVSTIPSFWAQKPVCDQQQQHSLREERSCVLPAPPCSCPPPHHLPFLLVELP